MLDKLRDPTKTRSVFKKTFYLFLFAIIILAFVFMTGTGNSIGGAAGGIAAVVNGEVVTYRDFAEGFDRQESRLQGSLKGIPDAMRKTYEQSIGTRGQRASRFLDNLIQNKLATQLAGESGVIVSDKEVATQIANMEVFQEDGQFKSTRYQQLLQANNLSPKKFEKTIKSDLAFSRFRRIFAQSLKATTKDLELDNFAQNQKINLDYLEVSQDALKKNIKVSDEDVKAFQAKESAKVKTYYEDNKSEFTVSEKVGVSHILIKSKSQSDADYKIALEKINGIRSQVTETNFADLAKKHSDDGSKAKGGSLGEVDKNVAFVEPFKKAVFSLKVNELSQPVKTRFGYHLIKVTGKTAGKVKALTEVSEQISKKFLTETKVSSAMDALTKDGKSPSLDEVQKLKEKYQIKWSNTGKFSLAQNQVPRIGNSSKIWKAVSEVLTNKNMQVVDHNGRYFLLKLKEAVVEPADKKNTPGLAKIDQLTNERTQFAVQTWLDEQKGSASIKKVLDISNFN